MNNKVTKNFWWSEFLKSQIARRHNIDNIPTENDIYHNIELLTNHVLQPVRNRFGGIRITSGYRSEELNSIIGGSIYSNHCKGQAADIEPTNTDISLLDIVLWIYNSYEFRELICEYWPDGWIHVAYRENANNRQLKIKDDEYNYEQVPIETVIGKYNGAI